MGQDLIITIVFCASVYIMMFITALGIFSYEYYGDNMTLFDVIVLSIFGPITVPYKLIKTLIITIRKI